MIATSPRRTSPFVCLEGDCFRVFGCQKEFVEHKAECYALFRGHKSFESALKASNRSLSAGISHNKWYALLG